MSLFQGRAQEILARLADGDPLGVGQRVTRAIARRHLLIDRDAVLMRAWTLCAREGARGGRGMQRERWLDERVDEALDALLEEGVAHGDSPHVTQLAREFGLSDRRLALACERFNRLPDACRQAFFQLVLEARPIEDLLYPGGPTRQTLARRARRALVALGQRVPEESAEARA